MGAMALRTNERLPTGTVTFLFTDVESSTRTAADIGDERYADVQEHHRILLREAFTSSGGVEVATEGDALFVAFRAAGDAVAAAASGQRALAESSPLRVRMGLHTGEAVVRDNDYVGRDVHKAKRVSDAGHGGQILLSQTTADLVRSTVRTKDLGAFRLKDFDEAEHLFQVVADDLDQDFPPPRTRDAFRHNLPAQRTSFIGRDREIARVRELLKANRLVTIVGVGGSGKTRLAVEAARRSFATHVDGVYFCDLAAVSEPQLLPNQVVSAMGIGAGGMLVPAAHDSDPVISFLADKQVLLILDNCEHLLEPTADYADAILERCPSVRIVATSREALDVVGEHTYPLRSLTLPDPSNVEGSDAVLLFYDRARAARDDFELTEQNAVDVSDICRRLDGMPLAIELAAAQVGHLAPAQIAQRLDDRFALLTGGRRRVQRQQTLAAAVDWSYDLLSEDEQLLLRRLAVFPSTFTADAAQQVCDLGARADLWSLLRSLVRKSLVTPEGGDETKYLLLETIRFYAQEKLVASGEADDIRSRHRDHVLESIGRDVVAWGFGPESAGHSQEREPDLWAALAWSQQQGRLDLVGRLAATVLNVWMANFEEGIRWVDIALTAVDDLPRDVQADLFAARAWLGVGAVEDMHKTASFARRAVEAGGSEPNDSVAGAYGILALMRSFEGVASGTDVAEEVRELGRRGLELAASPNGTLMTVFNYGFALVNVGDIGGAIAALERTRAQSGENVLPPSTVTATLAVLYHLTDEHELALRNAQDAYEFMKRSVTTGWTLYFTLPLGLCRAADGDHEGALEIARRFVDAPEAMSIPGILSGTATYLGVLSAIREDWERASMIFATVRAAFGRGDVRGPTDLLLYAKYAPMVGRALPDEVKRRCRDRGAAMSLEDAVALGLGRRDA